jgi:hypothetical protein
MRVYRVRLDVNRYQYFLPEDEDIYKTDRLVFDCGPKLADWVPPPVYVYQPKLKRGNFSSFLQGTDCLIVDREAMQGLREILEKAGELLPLPHEGQTYHILNVTRCLDALDKDHSEWVIGSQGAKLRIKRYAFHPDRLLQSDSSVFKVAEQRRGGILTYVAANDPGKEFKPAVERLGLKGLVFEEVWSDEK